MISTCGPGRLLRVPWTARRSNQSILKEISPEYSLEGHWSCSSNIYLIWRTDSLEKADVGKDWRLEEKGTTEDMMVVWHHWLNGHEVEQALEVGEGQGSLMCCRPWGRKESDMTEWLNWIYHKLFGDDNKSLTPCRVKFHHQKIYIFPETCFFSNISPS